jgi:predicted permease
VFQDVRCGVRVLTGRPVPTFVAVLSLALGIGANTAIFSMVYGILWRGLPFEEPDRVVSVRGASESRGFDDGEIAFGDLQDLRDSGVFEAVGAVASRNVTLTGGDFPERVQGASITPEIFSLIGVEPILGRDFTADDAAEIGFEEVVILSEGLWRARFGADRTILGRTVGINDRELAVVGIMPPGFRFPEIEDLWLPLGTDDPTNRTRRYLWPVGRLAEGTSLRAARERIAALSERRAVQFADTYRDWRMRVLEFRDDVINPGARRMMVLLLGSVAFVLLIACANVAHLQLARATDRGREIALRAALGAGRARVVRLLLTESLMLAVSGALLGLLAAHWFLWALWSVVPENETHYWMRVEIDAATLLFTAGLSLLAGLTFGIMPALQATRLDLHEAIKSSARGAGAYRHSGARTGLVVVEVALAVVLLIGATLMMRSFLELQVADPGFDDSRLVSMRLNLAGDHYDEPVTRAAFWTELVDALTAVPGAVSTVATSAIPADDGGANVSVVPPDGSGADDDGFAATAVLSTDGLYETLGASLLAGRDFTREETLDPEARVTILGEGLANRLFGGDDPIGREIRLESGGTPVAYRVIGVSPLFQYEEFGEDTPSEALQLHLPYSRAGWRGMNILVRTSADPGPMITPIRDTLARLDPMQAPFDILTMADRRSFTTWPQRVFGKVFGAFGALALILAASGIYGVIAYAVARRTREIGIRMALGARAADVVREAVRSATGTALAGVVVGLALAIPLAQLMRGILYGVSAADPSTFVAVALVLLLAAMVAAWVPARRAARVDPTEALREE